MDVKNFVLSYYKNATDEIHIQKSENSYEAEKPHTHDYFQIYYVIKGRIIHYVGSISAQLSCGDVFIIPPGVQHHIKRNEINTVFYSFSFMPVFFDDLDRSNKLAYNFLIYLKGIPGNEILPKVTIPTEETFHVETIMNQIMKEFSHRDIGNDEIIRSYACILLSIFARAYFNVSIQNISIDFETNKHFVMHCIEYINNNFTEDITLEDISKKSAMSKTCFCNLFLSLTGYSFKAYVNMLRIEKAMKLMESDYKITNIAHLCGYSEFSTFYRNFKKYTGVSPIEYKKINATGLNN